MNCEDKIAELINGFLELNITDSHVKTWSASFILLLVAKFRQRSEFRELYIERLKSLTGKLMKLSVSFDKFVLKDAELAMFVDLRTTHTAAENGMISVQIKNGYLGQIEETEAKRLFHDIREFNVLMSNTVETYEEGKEEMEEKMDYFSNALKEMENANLMMWLHSQGDLNNCPDSEELSESQETLSELLQMESSIEAKLKLELVGMEIEKEELNKRLKCAKKLFNYFNNNFNFSQKV